MIILTINSGSSSIKYKLIDMKTESSLAEGLIERIGEPNGKIVHHIDPDSHHSQKQKNETYIADHGHGMELIIELLTDSEIGVIEDRSDISAIGHRVVQGGERFKEPALIDDTVIEGIRHNIPLAPLHNPGALSGIITALEIFPNTVHVAVFDTAFHQTIPAKAYRYAIPNHIYEDAGVRRFGFHGTSHKYVTQEAAKYCNQSDDEINLISMHLGNGSSITAVRKGKSVDTSMGMTPLEGVIMGTRCGTIDPAIIEYLVKNQSLTLREIMTILTKESGLKGLCGYNDLRDIHEAIAAGDPNAELALDMLVYSYRNYIGAYFTVLKHVDCLVFTAGIGENDAFVREAVCKDLDIFGIQIDPVKNANPMSPVGIISTVSSQVTVLVIRTNEELEMARQIYTLMSAPLPVEEVDKTKE